MITVRLKRDYDNMEAMAVQYKMPDDVICLLDQAY
jgi:hypothetical protein